MKQTIKITESELRNVIKNCVNEALNEIGDTPRGQYMLGALQAKRQAQAERYKELTPQSFYYIEPHNQQAYRNGMQRADDIDTYAVRQTEKNYPCYTSDANPNQMIKDHNTDMHNAHQQGYWNYKNQYYNHVGNYKKQIPQKGQWNRAKQYH